MSDRGGDTFYVDQQHVGRIIGKGGDRIRGLQDECGCQIKIESRNCEREGQARVDLTGDSQSKQHARELIDDICSQPAYSGGRGNGRRGGGGSGGGYAGRSFGGSGGGGGYGGGREGGYGGGREGGYGGGREGGYGGGREGGYGGGRDDYRSSY